MSQHDYIINNDTAANVRSDINSALAAIATTNSGTTAPPSPSKNMLWYDEANDLLKIRNEANSAWITMGTVDQTNTVFNPNFLPATQAEAQAGTNNTKGMTPLRVAQAIAALAAVADGSVTTAKLADGSVTAIKLASAVVTTAKISYATSSTAYSWGSGGGSATISISPYTTLWINGGTNPALNAGAQGSISAPSVYVQYGSSSNGSVSWRYIVT